VKYLIVNADDFGASPGINRGILQAHHGGIVTSASLMVNMPAAEEAAALCREAPELSVGLHVDFTSEHGMPVVVLADSEQCRKELHRQFRRFQELMDRLPTHLDSHHHVHRKPHLLPHFLDLASHYRLPMREHSRVRYLGKFYGRWDDGKSHPEWIGARSLMRMLETEVQQGCTELSCHPGFVDAGFRSSYSAEREVEVGTLCDPALGNFLAACQIRLIGFRDLADLLSDFPASRERS